MTSSKKSGGHFRIFDQKPNLKFNPFIKNLPVYQPGRPIEEVARELGLPLDGIIKLASNENPFGPSPLAQAAMQKAIAGVNLYPDGNAFYLKQKLAKKLGVEPANLILGNGSNEIIEFAGHACLLAVTPPPLRTWSSRNIVLPFIRL